MGQSQFVVAVWVYLYVCRSGCSYRPAFRKGDMPKNHSSMYRENETRERASAAASSLEHVAAMHLRAAVKWGELAARQEKIEQSS